jgi:uncharacterized protein YjbI with pentapeptide repeats
VRQPPPTARVRLLGHLNRIRFELRQALVPDWLLGEERAWRRWQVVRWTIRIIVVLGLPILVGYAYDITLWNWMNLLIIPLVIAGIGIWFNSQQRAREMESAERRAQEDALETYLKDMTTLLVDNKLHKAQLGDDLSTVARARTLTVLNRLFHSVNNREVLRFLYESKLIGTLENAPVVSLRGAALPNLYAPGVNLQGAHLQRTNLVDAMMPEAQLQQAKLQEARLGTAWLTAANLQGARLQKAWLYKVDLEGADLTDTDLQGAEIFEANLVGVDLSKTVGLTQAQLDVALGAQETRVPDYLQQPEAWSMPVEEQRLRLRDLPQG